MDFVVLLVVFAISLKAVTGSFSSSIAGIDLITGSSQGPQMSPQSVVFGTAALTAPGKCWKCNCSGPALDLLTHSSED